MLKEELKMFNVDLDKIDVSDNYNDFIKMAIDKMALYYPKNELEVVLNENLLEVRNKYTDIKTIFGIKVSLASLEKDLSFIVKLKEEQSADKLF